MSSEDKFRQAAQAVVDLVFTDDMELFDSMHDEVQADLGPALSALGDPVEDGSPLEQLVAAALIVEEIAGDRRAGLPRELSILIDSMKDARKKLDQPH